MLTFRRLHRSRFAMRSVVSDASIVSSLSHRRPRAMAATSVARVSARHQGWRDTPSSRGLPPLRQALCSTVRR
jgi:hypothetical protein